MKKIISVILVTFLLVLAALALAACDSGVHSEEDWDKAMERLATCDAITVTIEDKQVDQNNLVNKRTHKRKMTITFDAQQGVVHAEYESKTLGAIGEDQGSGKREEYYVADGSAILYYTRRLTESSDKAWSGNRWTYGFNSEDDVTKALREKYLHAKYSSETEYLDLTTLKYGSFYEDKNTYQRTEKEEYNNIAYKLTFTNGFLTEVYYEKVQNSSGPKDSRKYTIKIKYTACITLPTDLPEVK